MQLIHVKMGYCPGWFSSASEWHWSIGLYIEGKDLVRERVKSVKKKLKS